MNLRYSSLGLLPIANHPMFPVSFHIELAYVLPVKWTVHIHLSEADFGKVDVPLFGKSLLYRIGLRVRKRMVVVGQGSPPK